MAQRSESTIEKHQEIIHTLTGATSTGDTSGAKGPPPWTSLFAFTTRKHTAPLSVALLLAIGAGAVNPVLAIFLGRIFNAFSAFGAGTVDEATFRHNVSKESLSLLGLGSISWLLNGGFFIAWVSFGELQAKSCRSRVFDGLLQKSIAWFDKRKSGVATSMSRAQAQIRELQLATSQPLGSIVEHVVTGFVSLSIAFYYSWTVTLVTLSTLPVTALFLGWVSKRIQPAIAQQREELSVAMKHANNAFVSIETIKCFNGESTELQKYRSSITSAAKWYIKQAQTNALQNGFVRVFTMAMFAQGFWFGSHLVRAGHATTGAVITSFWSSLTATQAIEQILPYLLVLEKGRAAGGTLNNMSTKRSPINPSLQTTSATMPHTCVGQVDFDRVSFCYPARPTQLVLKDISCSFIAGQTTFVIGKSGSGKSTIQSLLLKFYEPNAGSISVDGKLLSQLDCNWIRENITLVEQHSVLFEGSLWENIALGKGNYTHASEDEIKSATEFALLQQVIGDLPQGLITPVGTKGNSLSGGQRQRMALARARLRDTPILILDESTSALDAISRSMMMEAIRQWRRGKTTIIVTHEISQLLTDDYAYLFEDGRIIQGGYRFELEAQRHLGFGQFLPKDLQYHQLMILPYLERGFNQRASLDHSYTTSLECTGEEEADEFGDTTPLLPYLPAIFSNPQAPGVGLPHNSNLRGSPVRTPPTQLKARTNRPVELKRRSRLSAIMQSPLSIFEESPITNDLMYKTGLSAVEKRSALIREHLPRAPVRKAEELEQLLEAERVYPPSLKEIFRTIWPALTRKHHVMLVAGFTGAAIHAGATPMFSYIFSKLLGTLVQPEGGAQAAIKWSVAILGLAVVDAHASYFFHLLLEKCGQVWIDKSRVEALKRILGQPKHFFTQSENNSTILAQSLDRDAEEMRNLLGRFGAFMFIAAVMTVVALVWSLATCWKLTLVGLSIGPASFAVTRGFQTVSALMEGRCNDAASAAGSILNECFTNIKTVKALTLEDHFRKKHSAAVQKALRVGIKKAIYSGIFFGISEAMIVFITALIFYYGAILAASGQFSMAHILLVLSMLLFCMSNLSAIVAFIPQIQLSKDTASRLLRLAQMPIDSHEQQGSARICTVGDIVFRNVDFAYPGKQDDKVLHRVNLTFPRGTSTALVGASGSGKSTIASLLLRMYSASPAPTAANPSPPSGITISGRDITRIDTPTLRSLIATVPQQTTLFPTTVSENITYGLPPTSPHATPAAIHAAAAAAGIDAFITSLPQGYDTLIGDGGLGLSGGQAQRIAIARALVRRPAVLIFDEATSALDVESAGMVRESVRRLLREREGGLTVVLITHAREMMEIAERVVMLDAGRVVEEGSFGELVERGGMFANLLRGGVWVGKGEEERDGSGKMMEDEDRNGGGKGKGKERKVVSWAEEED